MLAATQPYIKRNHELPSERCKGNFPKQFEMEPLDKIYASELVEEIKRNDFVLFIQHNYTPFQSERVYKNTLIKSGGNFRSHKNVVYKKAFEELGVDNRVQSLFVTRNSLVIGSVEKLPACVLALKKMPQFLLLGGCIDGEVYSHADLTSISKQSNIDMCRVELVSILETPAVDLADNLEQYVISNAGKGDEDGNSDSQNAADANSDKFSSSSSSETSSVKDSQGPETSEKKGSPEPPSPTE